MKKRTISARPDNLGYRTATFVQRNRAIAALATPAMAAVIAGTVSISIPAHTARTQRDQAIHQLMRAERVADLNELLMTDVAPTGKPVTVDQLLRLEERVVRRENYNDAANHVEMLLALGHQYSNLSENTKAISILEEALQLSQALEDHSIHARASCVLSEALPPIGELARAESLFQEGLRELADNPQFARIAPPASTSEVRSLITKADPKRLSNVLKQLSRPSAAR